MKRRKQKNRGELHLRIVVAFIIGILIVAMFFFVLLFRPQPLDPSLDATRTALDGNQTTIYQLKIIDAQATISWKATQTAIATP